jgi:hypothetical protein
MTSVPPSGTTDDSDSPSGNTTVGGIRLCGARRRRDEIRLCVASDLDTSTAKHSAYLWVDNSDALANERLAVGAEVHMPEDTEWGQHEGAVVDPDGNVLRFGSPMD